MEVLFVLLLVGDHGGGRDGRLGHHVVQHGPVVLLLVEVRHARLLDAVRNADVDSVWRQNAVDFVQSLLRVRAAAVAAEDGVEGALVDDRVEGAVLEVAHVAHVHLLVGESGVLLAVELCHLLDHGGGDVDVGYVLEAVVEHFFGETYR